MQSIGSIRYKTASPSTFGSSQLAIRRGCGTSVPANAANTWVSRMTTTLLRGRRCFGPRRSTYGRPDLVNRNMMFCVPPLILETFSSGPLPNPWCDIHSVRASRATGSSTLEEATLPAAGPDRGGLQGSRHDAISGSALDLDHRERPH